MVLYYAVVSSFISLPGREILLNAGNTENEEYGTNAFHDSIMDRDCFFVNKK